MTDTLSGPCDEEKEFECAPLIILGDGPMSTSHTTSLHAEPIPPHPPQATVDPLRARLMEMYGIDPEGEGSDYDESDQGDELDHERATMISIRTVGIFLGIIPVIADVIAGGSDIGEVKLLPFYCVAAAFLAASGGLWSILRERLWAHLFLLLAATELFCAYTFHSAGVTGWLFPSSSFVSTATSTPVSITTSAPDTAPFNLSAPELFISASGPEWPTVDTSLIFSLYAITLVAFWASSCSLVWLRTNELKHAREYPLQP